MAKGLGRSKGLGQMSKDNESRLAMLLGDMAKARELDDKWRGMVKENMSASELVALDEAKHRAHMANLVVTSGLKWHLDNGWVLTPPSAG